MIQVLRELVVRLIQFWVFLVGEGVGQAIGQGIGEAMTTLALSVVAFLILCALLFGFVVVL